MTDTTLTISDTAAKHIAAVKERQQNADLMFRITVAGGGCSGFKYIFEFDDETFPNDLTFEKNGVKVVTDPTSMQLLKGAEVDFLHDLMGSRFNIKNPNAASGCGCGTSFSPDPNAFNNIH